MIASRPAREIDVFAQLDLALRARDEQTPIAHATRFSANQSTPHRSHASVAVQIHVTKILKLRVLCMFAMGCLRWATCNAPTVSQS